MPGSGGRTLFLSYAREDAEAARRIAEALRAEGLDVWFDANELRGGDVWAQTIRRQIKDCALFIAVISATTQERAEGYFRREWHLAVDRTRDMADDHAFIVPVIVDDTEEAEARVPEEFLRSHVTRLRGQTVPPEFVEQVKRLLASGRNPAPGTRAPERVPVRPNRRWAAPVAVLAAVVVAAALWLGHRAGPATGPSDGAVADADRRAIAVLPFLDMSPGKNQGYMSDGLAEELLNLLSKVPGLRVTSRSSAFSFKDKNLDVPEIAKRLRVSHILEGSVRTSGDRLRVDAQLIDARTDTSVWSETYQRSLDDIFAVQDEIANAVVTQLKVRLLGAPPKSTVVDTKAYALFLQARPLARLHSAEGYEQSNALYKQVLAIDPNYVPAWDGLAYNYRRQANNGMRPLEEGYQLAREALARALAIDPDYAPSIAALGRIALDHDGDLAEAARQLERAQALAPSDPDIVYTAARVAEGLGRLRQSMSLDQFALQHDPLNPTLQNIVGIDFRYAGRLDESVEAFRSAIRLSPGNISAHFQLGVSLLLKGDHRGALEAMQQEPSEAWRTVGLPLAYHALGDRANYDASVARMIEVNQKKWPSLIATVFAYSGQSDRAFEWLDRAVASHDPNLATIAIEPLCAGLFADPRWKAFLRKIGRSPEQLDPIRLDVRLPAA
jgi:TolB-like protein/Tfp pilus assembly protein PilF